MQNNRTPGSKVSPSRHPLCPPAGAAKGSSPIWAVGPSALPCAGAAPPQRPPRLATVFTLPQHRVWRTVSTPPLAASTHRPPTTNHRSSTDDWCSTENKKLKTKNCSSGRSGLRPSLVQGLRPRNAPLQNHASPAVRLHFSMSPGEQSGGRQTVKSSKACTMPRMTGSSSNVAQ